MRYLIDGHNLIGKLTDISLEDPDDEAKLVQKLLGFVARTKDQCVVVFDYGVPAGVSRMSTRSVRVVFASSSSNADRVIMDRIYKEKNPKQWSVVTEDNQVLNAARKCRMQLLRSTQFANRLARPLPPPKPDIGEADDVSLSDEEVDEWIDFFKQELKKKKKKK